MCFDLEFCSKGNFNELKGIKMFRRNIYSSSANFFLKTLFSRNQKSASVLQKRLKLLIISTNS